MPVATGIEIVEWALPGIELKDMYVQNSLVLLACGFEVVRPCSEPSFFVFQDYSSLVKRVSLMQSHLPSKLRSSDIKKQVRSILLTTQILNFDFLSMETHIFQS